MSTTKNVEGRWVSEAKDCVNAFKQNAGRYPERDEISGFAWMFTPHTEEIGKVTSRISSTTRR